MRDLHTGLIQPGWCTRANLRTLRFQSRERQWRARTARPPSLGPPLARSCTPARAHGGRQTSAEGGAGALCARARVPHVEGRADVKPGTQPRLLPSSAEPQWRPAPGARGTLPAPRAAGMRAQCAALCLTVSRAACGGAARRRRASAFWSSFSQRRTRCCPAGTLPRARAAPRRRTRGQHRRAAARAPSCERRPLLRRATVYNQQSVDERREVE